ncbi:MAG: hypothetical protein PHE88_06190, partial [Elusimicrobia bacterium]|nr:hypothetical protein [Elusimicrobiota bacterium]
MNKEPNWLLNIKPKMSLRPAIDSVAEKQSMRLLCRSFHSLLAMTKATMLRTVPFIPIFLLLATSYLLLPTSRLYADQTVSDATFVYGRLWPTGASTGLKCRTWDGTSWSDEADGPDSTVGGPVIYQVLKSSSPNNPLKVWGGLRADGIIYVSFWNGSSWSTPKKINSSNLNVDPQTTTPGQYPQAKIFDIAYSTNNVIVVWTTGDGTTTTQLKYSLYDWDQKSWTVEESNVDNASVVIPATAQKISWVGLYSSSNTDITTNPNAGEVMLVWSLPVTQASPDVYAAVWASSVAYWVRPTQLNSGVSNVTKRCFDAVWVDSMCYVFTLNDGANTVNIDRWNGYLWQDWGSPACGGGSYAAWIKVAGDPTSKRIAIAVADINNDLWTGLFKHGNAPATMTQAFAARETDLETVMLDCFDIAYTTGTGDAIAVWSANPSGNNTHTLDWGKFNGDNAWANGSNIAVPLGSDPQLVTCGIDGVKFGGGIFVTAVTDREAGYVMRFDATSGDFATPYGVQISSNIIGRVGSPLVVNGDIMVYGVSNRKPALRTYDGLNRTWGAESITTLGTRDANSGFVKIADSSIRNQRVVVEQTTKGEIYAQAWNVDTGWGTAQPLVSAPYDESHYALYREFDVAVQSLTGDFVVVYVNNAGNLKYQSYSGSNKQWGGETSITYTATGRVIWPRLEANPSTSSNELLLAFIDQAGGLWTTPSMNVLVSTQAVPAFTTFNIANPVSSEALEPAQGAVASGLNQYQPSGFSIQPQCFDIAYEQAGGYRGMITYAADARRYLKYRLWISTAGAIVGEKNLQNATDNVTQNYWVKLAPCISTWTIAVAFTNLNYGAACASLNVQVFQDGNTLADSIPAANTQVIAGAAATGMEPHQYMATNIDQTQQSMDMNRPFDIMYVRGLPQKLVAAYTYVNSSKLYYKVYTLAAGWTPASPGASDIDLGAAGVGPTIQQVQLHPDPNKDSIGFVVFQAEDSVLRVSRWLGDSMDSTIEPAVGGTAIVPNLELRQENFWLEPRKDTIKPGSIITTPSPNNVHLNTWTNPNTFVGTSTDNFGVNKTEVSIKKTTCTADGSNPWDQYWNGKSWAYNSYETSTWIQANSGWNYGVSASSAVSPATYLVKARATDVGGLVEDNFSDGTNQMTFVYDVNLPSSTVTYPKSTSTLTNESYLKIVYSQSNITISGNCADDLPGLVSTATIRLSCAGSSTKKGYNWNWGTAVTGTWQNSSQKKDITITGGSWSTTVSTAAFGEDNTTYYISVQICDKAGNWQAAPSTNTFVIDNTTPTSTVAWPDSSDSNTNKYSALTNITGVATDNFNVVVTSIAICIKDGNYWNGTDAFNQEGIYWNTVPGNAKNWSYPAPTQQTDNAIYQIFTRSGDYAGNQEASDSTIKREYVIDKTTPTSVVVLPANGGWYGTNSLPSISGTAKDGPDVNSQQKLYAVYTAVRNLTYSATYWNWNASAWDNYDSANSWYRHSTPSDLPLNVSSTVWTRTFASWGTVSGSSFCVISKARDLAKPNNFYQELLSYSTFWWDVDVGVSTMTYPIPGGDCIASPYFIGEATDTIVPGNPSGRVSLGRRVEVKLLKKDTGLYWQSDGAWVATLPEDSWPSTENQADSSYSVNKSTWSIKYNSTTSGMETLPSGNYHMFCRVVDNAGNIQTTFSNSGVYRSSVSFSVDALSPCTYITIPNTDLDTVARTNTLATISGTASDPPSYTPTKVVEVRVAILDRSLGNGTTSFWSPGGSNWVDGLIVTPSTYAVCSLDTTVTPMKWGYPVPSTALTSGHKYEVFAWAKDNAGNWQSNPTANRGDNWVSNSTSSVKRFLWDTGVPTSSMTAFTCNSFLSSLGTISGTAADNSGGIGVYNVQVRI